MTPQDSPADDADGFPVSFWRLLALGSVVGVVSGTLSYVLQVLLNPKIVQEPIGQYVWVVLFNILAWTSWLLLLPLVWRLSSRVPISGGRRTVALTFHAAASVAVAAVHCAMSAGLKLWVLRISGQPDPVDGVLSYQALFTGLLLYAFEWEVLLYWGVLAANHALNASRELRRRELHEARLEARFVEAKLESLQRQLQPHFVFNTLHAITSLLHRDINQAESMLVRLGDLLRAVFRSHAHQQVPLARELDLLQHYLEIQRVRFGGTLTCELDVPLAARSALVPILVLQPLVENAIRHGFGGRAGGVIRVSARQVDERLEVTVTDNGCGPSASAREAIREGVGLSNTRARLEHLFPGRNDVRLNAPVAGGFSVALSLPWQAAPASLDAQALDIPA
jgi:two-component system LytT family sensor kinase